MIQETNSDKNCKEKGRETYFNHLQLQFAIRTRHFISQILSKLM